MITLSQLAASRKRKLIVDGFVFIAIPGSESLGTLQMGCNGLSIMSRV